MKMMVIIIVIVVYRVREKTAPLNKMLKNAQYITQSNDTYTA